MPTTCAPMRWPIAAWKQRVASVPERLLDPPREHLHLLAGLLVALALRDRDAFAVGGKRLCRPGRCRRARGRAPSTPPCNPGSSSTARRRCRRPRRARRRPSGTRCRARSAAAPPSLPAASIRSKLTRAGDRFGHGYLPDELAALAIDAAHRIDHLAVLALELAFDRRVQPAFGAAPIDDPLRKIVRRDSRT